MKNSSGVGCRDLAFQKSQHLPLVRSVGTSAIVGRRWGDVFARVAAAALVLGRPSIAWAVGGVQNAADTIAPATASVNIQTIIRNERRMANLLCVSFGGPQPVQGIQATTTVQPRRHPLMGGQSKLALRLSVAIGVSLPLPLAQSMIA